MKEILIRVKEFHNAFGVETPNKITLNTAERRALRDRLINEEAKEVSLELLTENPDIQKIAKELCDLLYVIGGTVLELGLEGSMQAIFNEVHRSNMSKLDADGNPIYRGDKKILKSDLYTKPNLDGLGIRCD